MQKPNRKGQGAMEYVMVYGWAIMVVIVAGVALWYMGVFNLGVTPKNFKGFEPLKPLSWAVYSDGSASIIMVSAETTIITITDVGGDCDFNLPNETHISPGGRFQITADAGDCDTGAAKGGVYHIEVRIIYSKSISAVPETHSSTGTIHGQYE